MIRMQRPDSPPFSPSVSLTPPQFKRNPLTEALDGTTFAPRKPELSHIYCVNCNFLSCLWF